MSYPLRITPVYDLLLRGSAATRVGFYHLRMATAAQLCRLHYSPGSITTVKARLKNLADAGYIQVDAIPTKFFRSPYYYCLGQKGMRYLADTGLDMDEAFRADREGNKHSLFIEHTLEVNDVLIAAALLNRVHPNFYLDSFMHERALKRRPYKASWKTNGTSQVFTIIPDAFLDFRLALPNGSQRRMPILLEHDRGTEGKNHFKRRIRAYITLLKTGAYQQFFGVKAITIAFTTFVSPERLAHMREWTRQELAASNEPKQLGTTFCFTRITQPLATRQLWLEPHWYTPYAEDAPIALLTD
jgi:Replication-relaxation